MPLLIDNSLLETIEKDDKQLTVTRFNELYNTIFFEKQKDGSPSLTLEELTALRSNRQFWSFFQKEKLIISQSNSRYPLHLFPVLLDLIDSYFVSKSDGIVFKQAIKLFSSYLALCPELEVNNFYSIKIRTRDRTYFLIDILLQCMQPDDSLEEKLYAVAAWLCQYNPSLISNNPNLEPVYEKLRVGKYFDLKRLQELIIALKIERNDVAKRYELNLLKYLNKVIGTQKENDQNTINFLTVILKEMYKARWERIIDTHLDYMRQQHKENAAWIKLAQSLMGAGYIKDYLKLLIWTLTDTNDPVTQSSISDFYLSDCILSTNGKKIIPLANCKAHYEQHHTFYNCDTSNGNSFPIPLSSVELIRVMFASSEYSIYYQVALEEDTNDPEISKQTVDALHKLVNGTLHIEGLYKSEVEKPKYEITKKHYEEFLIFLSQLPQLELDNLLRQTIYWEGKRRTFVELMDSIQHSSKEQRLCSSALAKLIAVIVMNYAPNGPKFHNEIEKSVNIDAMRANSTKRTYSDYTITEEEAARRIMVVLVSILTHKFTFLWQFLPGIGYWIDIEEYYNKVPDIIYEIFNFLYKSIKEETSFRYTYATLVEHIVKPAIVKNPLTRFRDTNEWLNSIKDGSLYTNDNNVCFEPEVILATLWPLAKKNPSIKPLITDFLGRLFEILVSSENDYIKWIEVNIELRGLFKDSKLSQNHYSVILKQLYAAEETNKKIREDGKDFTVVDTEATVSKLKDTNQTPISSEKILHICVDFLMDRIESQNLQTNVQLGLFGVSPGLNKANYQSLSKVFAKYIKSFTLKKEMTMDDIIKQAQLLVEKIMKSQWRLSVSHSSENISLTHSRSLSLLEEPTSPLSAKENKTFFTSESAPHYFREVGHLGEEPSSTNSSANFHNASF